MDNTWLDVSNWRASVLPDRRIRVEVAAQPDALVSLGILLILAGLALQLQR